MEKQLTPEWFEKRKGKITGSSVGAILGLSPYQKPEDVMRRMVRDFHGAENEVKDNIVFQYGRLNEKFALADFEDETFLSVKETGFNVSEQYEWLGASPDGLVGDDAIIEIKCPFSKRESSDFKSIKEMPHYYAQVQIELFCTNRKKAYFFQWSKVGNKLETINIDNDWLDENIPLLEEFYQDYLIELMNPCHLEPLVKEMTDDDLINEYNAAVEADRVAKERLASVKKRIFEKANGEKTRISDRLVYPVMRQGAVNYQKIVTEHMPDFDVELYRSKPTQYMVIK